MKTTEQLRVLNLNEINLNTENRHFLGRVKTEQSMKEIKGPEVPSQRLQAFISPLVMGNTRRNFFLVVFPFFLFLTACSSKSAYQPEVGGEGAQAVSKSGQAGVIYSIPSENPVLKMRLGSAVLPGKTKTDAKALVRMFFLRKGSAVGAYLDPQEQILLLPDSQAEIRPSRVHANSKSKPLVKLDGSEKQAVELEFPLPSGGAHQYPYIQLKWKIHYRQKNQDKTMSEVERFDWVHKYEPQQGVGHEFEWGTGFPYTDSNSPLPLEWMDPGFFWW